MKVLIRYLPRWSIALFLVFALAGAGVALAAPLGQGTPADAAGVGFDPLTDGEAAAALNAAGALRSVSASAVRASAAGPGQVAVAAPAEEIVLVERHQESKDDMAAGAWPRRADLFLYRYADDTLVHGLYDYASGQTTTVEEVRGVQLPLSDGERDTAIAVAFADPALRADIGDEYRLITGNALTNPAQLSIRIFNYRAGANPEIETPAVQACAINRCAQLLMTVADDVTLNVLPIVNLSTLSVASANALPLDVQDNHAGGGH